MIALGIAAVLLVLFAGVGIVDVTQRVLAWLEERRRHDCAFREQLDEIRQALELPDHAAPWLIGEQAVNAITAFQEIKGRHRQ